MRMRASVVVVAAVAVSLGWLALDWRPSPRAANDDAARIELVELRAETARLRAAVSALEQQVRSAPQVPARATAATPPGVELVTAKAAREASDTPRAEPLDPAREREQTLQYARYLDDHLARTPGADAAALVGTLRADVEGVLEEQAVLLDIRCGADMCRVETRHQSGDAYRAFQARGFRQGEPLWPGPSTFILLEKPEAPDQPLVAVMYLGRKDALPSPEASL